MLCVGPGRLHGMGEQGCTDMVAILLDLQTHIEVDKVEVGGGCKIYTFSYIVWKGIKGIAIAVLEDSKAQLYEPCDDCMMRDPERQQETAGFYAVIYNIMWT